jgi:hypothetical protein
MRTILAAFVVVVAVAVAVAVGVAAQSNCDASDAAILEAEGNYCESMVGPGVSWCPMQPGSKGGHDWPTQVIIFSTIMRAFAGAPAACLNTSVATAVANRLEVYQSNVSLSGSLLNVWRVFQGQYYDMPRKAGVRIEAPWTLGMKCFAFAYLRQKSVVDVVASRLAAVGTSIATFAAAYAAAVPWSYTLCYEVEANCFLNTTYTPSRNGTCPGSMTSFYGGFQWMNVRHMAGLKYPFYPV